MVHRHIQEFLAACHLAAQDDFPAACARLARAAPEHWQVVLPLAARVAKTERGASAADELIGGVSISDFRATRQPVAADWICALLAGMQLQEIGVGAINTRERTRAIAARVAGWLAASLAVHPEQGGAPASQRAQAGDVLAALGDPRFDPNRFHLPADDLLGFVRIPADPQFQIGTRKADVVRVAEIIGGDVRADEINDALTPTSEFFIARYPVTVAQFRAYVEATGYKIWSTYTLRDLDNRPVRSVSWHEAGAYCEWLHKVLATSPVLASSEIARLVREDKWRVALPSELEWEKAARGRLSETVFSWGDEADPDQANYRDSEINDTSAAGCFPANGFGLYDMIGNVWEWTRSHNASYPHCGDDDGANLKPTDEVYRVLRGGSWNYQRDYARCAFRNWLPPVFRDLNIGFRVVLRSSPVSQV